MKKLYLIPLLITLIVFTSCSNSNNSTIKIGLIAGLSGKYSELGNGILQSVTLAFEEVGFKVNNQTIELIVKDDKQDSNTAKTQIKSLLDSNVHLIIGNATSSMTKISIDEIKNYNDVLLISPSASSDEFSNIKDNFLRTFVAINPTQFDEISKKLLNQKISNMAFVYDEKNFAYANSYMNNFETSFKNNGGKQSIFKITINESFPLILKKINDDKIDLIVIVANSIDCAKLIQYLRINHNNKTIFSSQWAKTSDFLGNGGKYVDGVLFVTSFDDTSLNPRYVEFVKKYQKRYGQMPSIFAAQAYETANIIIETLKKNGDVKLLKESILSTKSFDGLQGEILFNEFGDVSRNHFIITVQNGQFVKKE